MLLGNKLKLKQENQLSSFNTIRLKSWWDYDNTNHTVHISSTIYIDIDFHEEKLKLIPDPRHQSHQLNQVLSIFELKYKCQNPSSFEVDSS